MNTETDVFTHSEMDEDELRIYIKKLELEVDALEYECTLKYNDVPETDPGHVEMLLRIRKLENDIELYEHELEVRFTSCGAITRNSSDGGCGILVIVLIILGAAYFVK